MPSTSLSLIQQYLSWVDVWLARGLRRAEMAHGAESPSGGLFVTHAQAVSQLYRHNDLSLADAEETSLETALAEVQAQTLLADAELRAGGSPTIGTLVELFGLTDIERDILLVTLAPALEPRYVTLYGYLQDDVTAKQPRATFVLELLFGPSLQRLAHLPLLAENAPLRRLGLVEVVPVGEQTIPGSSLYENLQIDPTVMRWLLGDFQPHHTLAPYAHLYNEAHPALASLLVDSTLEQTIARAMDHNALLSLYGTDDVRRRITALAFAHRYQKPLLEIDLAAALAAQENIEAIVRLAIRDAQFANAIPCFIGWDENVIPSAIATYLFDSPTPVILQSKERWHSSGKGRTRPVVSHACPAPGYTERLHLWQMFLDDAATSFDLEGLAAQFALTTQQVEDSVATAHDIALNRGDALTVADLLTAARLHSTPRLGTLAYQIIPRFEWDDIVLPPEHRSIMQEIVNMVRGRGVVLEEWGIGRKLTSSNGVSALFAGPPGTGKTMAAEVIAGELGLDLYKIDLSTVVNKYIGETEKSLGRLFDEASASGSILFFDEADALFGKRSEVKDSHDRYANIEVSYLLQRMEQYDGVTILATNLRSSMDEAFTRRLQFAIDFPFPGERDRLHLWETLFPLTLPKDEQVDFQILARRFKLAGGNIRNIIVTAAHTAAANGRVVTQAHLMHGVRRELQKMGRLIDERDLRVSE